MFRSYLEQEFNKYTAETSLDDLSDEGIKEVVKKALHRAYNSRDDRMMDEDPHQLPRHWICATQDSTACGVFSTHSACAEVVRGESPGLGVPRGLPGLL